MYDIVLTQETRMSTTILTFTPTQVYSDRMAHTKSTESNRHLVLLDIENLAGTPDPTWSEIEYAKRQLDAVIPDFSSARCIVASSHIGAEVICFSFPKALRRLRSGPDGADLALIDEVLDDRLMARFMGSSPLTWRGSVALGSKSPSLLRRVRSRRSCAWLPITWSNL